MRVIFGARKRIGMVFVVWLLLSGLPATSVRADSFPTSSPPSVVIHDAAEKPEIGRHGLCAGPEGNLYAVWSEEAGGAGHVFFSGSRDDGRTWNEPVRVTDGSLSATNRHPCVVVDSANRVFVAWQQQVAGETWEVAATRSLDGGVSFEPPAAISHPYDGQDDVRPVMVSDQFGRVYVAWEHVAVQRKIDLTWSQDGGRTFEGAATVYADTTADGPLNPDLTVDESGHLHLVWEEQGATKSIFYMRSTGVNADRTWLDPIRVHGGPVERGPLEPVVAVGPSGELLVVWQTAIGDESSRHVMLSTSRDGSGSFALPVPLSPDDGSGGDQAHPAIQTDKTGWVYVAWHWAPLAGPGQVRVAASADYGATWTFLRPAGYGHEAATLPASPFALAVTEPGTAAVLWAEDLDVHNAETDNDEEENRPERPPKPPKPPIPPGSHVAVSFHSGDVTAQASCFITGISPR